MKFTILLILILTLLLGYGMHKLIRRFINPKQSPGHMFLFFMAHFTGIFVLSVIINFLLLRFSSFLFHP
ncbi:MAG: hypothetical protein WAT19_11455 [Ferruginibacter sp.]